MSTLVAMGAFAVLFVLAGWVRLRAECSGEGDCIGCSKDSCFLKKNETHDSL